VTRVRSDGYVANRPTYKPIPHFCVPPYTFLSQSSTSSGLITYGTLGIYYGTNGNKFSYKKVSSWYVLMRVLPTLNWGVGDFISRY